MKIGLIREVYSKHCVVQGVCKKCLLYYYYYYYYVIANTTKAMIVNPPISRHFLVQGSSTSWWLGWAGSHTALIGWPWARASAKCGLVPTAIGFHRDRDECNILGIYLIGFSLVILTSTVTRINTPNSVYWISSILLPLYSKPTIVPVSLLTLGLALRLK